MLEIPHIQDIGFREIEKLYIPSAVRFLRTSDDSQSIETQVETQYNRLLSYPIYKRAEYRDPLTYGVLAARGLGQPGWHLEVCILLSILLELSDVIEISEKEYRVVVFKDKVLQDLFGEEFDEVLKALRTTDCSNICLGCRRANDKIMFILEIIA